MKRKWKIFLSSLAAVASAGVVATACFLAFRDKPILPLDVYLLNFNQGNDQENTAKNNYINKMIDQTRSILDWYSDYYEQQYGKPFPGLTFDFINLTQSQSEGEKNYFSLLDRTLKAIDTRLGINNIPRTPASVQEGFYQKNTELLSFYWSPDYNSVATWLSYMFSDEFSIPNQWPSLYLKLINGEEQWCDSLRVWLDARGFLISPIEILNNNLKGISATAFYTALANTIGVWVEQNSNITISSTSETDPMNDKISEMGYGIECINWISSQIVNLPYVEDGYDSSTPYLIRQGYFNPTNPNSENNFRDWYFNFSNSNGDSTFRYWNATDPFESNKTPFNPAFSNAPSASFFNSTWTALTTWTTISNYHDIRNPNTPVGPTSTILVTSGSSDDIDTLEHAYDTTNNTLTINVRPIPWVDTNGQQLRDENGNLAYLSPQDYRASIIAFIRSIQISLNSNSYFIDLLSLDVEKTVNDPINNVRNTSSTISNPFVFHFYEQPEISIHSVLDILQKQYFCAIPAFKQSVKNIIDYNTFKNLIGATETSTPDSYFSDEKVLSFNSSNIDFYNFYGCGDPSINSSSWKDYAFASPYYISHIDEQQIIYQLNEKYFASFTPEELSQYNYRSFNLSETIEPTDENHNKETNVVKKINTVILKYAGSYSQILTYEQFKSNELDFSELSSSKLLEAKKEFKNDYRIQSIDKLNRSNLVGFNLQVYSKDFNSIILNQQEQPMMKEENGQLVVDYDIDEFGNYVFKQTPKLKSNISNAYYDLIVRDYYTPISAYDPVNGIYAASATIRETILNCINWVSLKSMVFPGITKSIQYSFLPYGVYQIGDEIANKKYWWLAAFKPYMSDEELANFNEQTYYARKSGMIIWTYNEMRNNMIKKGD